MWERLKKLISGMLNQGMSKLETPEILAEQAQSGLEDGLKNIKQSLADSITNEKTLEKKIAKNDEELKSWEQRAAVAVSQSNDDIARQCLVKKQEAQQNATDLQNQLAAQREASANLKKRYAEIEEQLREFQAKKSGMLARGEGSDALAKANELLNNPAQGMEKWEQKIQQKEALSAANQQLASEQTDLKKLTASSSVDDELARLKQSMAGSSPSSPKLIEDKSE